MDVAPPDGPADTGLDSGDSAIVQLDGDLDASDASDASDAEADATADTSTPDGAVGALPQVAVGNIDTCVRSSDGTVRCVGCNSSGSLGDGTGADSTSFVSVLGVMDAVGLWAGDEHNCVVRTDASGACWGWNTDGSTGGGAGGDALSPVTVAGLTDIAQLSPARTATCAVLRSGVVQCFGDNFFGQLGDGTQTDRATPQPVMGLAATAEVAGAEGHFCARTVGGEVWCWGWGSSGQLGDGTNTRAQLTPVRAGTIGDATQMTVGHSHSCAVRATGELWCWGANDSGQLGDNTYTARNVPAPVMTLTGVVEVTAGYVHTCARLRSGEVRCFGWSGDGSIGDGQTSVDRLLPVPVVGLTDAVQLSSSTIGGPTCAVRSTGEIVCWGNNDCGQFTDGTTALSSVPVPLTGLP